MSQPARRVSLQPGGSLQHPLTPAACHRCMEHPAMLQFLELSSLSLQGYYGPKMKEGWMFLWSTG